MKPPYDDTGKLGFGQFFTDYMFTMKYTPDKGWHEPLVEKYKSFNIDPAAVVLHYSQEIFEGLKAYKTEDGRVLLFRPEENARRMNRSAHKLCMPEIPEEQFLQALKDVIIPQKDWIPGDSGTSLYIRPTMIGIDPYLGLRTSLEFLFYIILSPVGPYFKEGFNPVSIYVEDTLVRAPIGGLGDVKTGGNYAASLYASVQAKKKGFTQVLWLDAKEHKYIEEVGAMNIVFVLGDKLVTPPLNGSILPGITRDSVIKLAGDIGYKVEERPISIDEVVEKVSSGELTEIFGAGTAAVISPVGSLVYKDKNYVVKDGQVGSVTRDLYNRLIDIQYGRSQDKYGWVHELGRY